MAGQCIEKLPHSCGSSDGLQTYFDNGKYTGYCHVCATYVPDPYGGNEPEIVVKTEAEIEQEVADARKCGFVNFTHRAIPPADWKYFGVRLGMSERDGVTPDTVMHPRTRDGKVVSFKVKLLNKKIMWSIGDSHNLDLYGWLGAKAVGGLTLYITEGEEDAIALRRILMEMNRGTAYAEQGVAVVSLNNGSDSAIEDISRHLDEINKTWKYVVLAFDNDGPGKKAAKSVKARLLPNCLIASLPAKDANACLRNGLMRATRDALIYNAAKPLPTSLLTVNSLIDEACEEVVFGLDYPWPGVTDLTYGQRKKELITIGAGVGVGKSLMAHELAAHNFRNHGWKTLMIMMEESPAETVRNVCGKLDDTPYHVPGTQFDKDVLRATANEIDAYIIIWNPDENSDPETTWAAIKQAIRTHGNDIDCVMLDNMTTASEGLDTSEKNEFIGLVAKEFVDLAMKFDFEAVVFSHLNTPAKGAKSHEEGGRVLESQFTGSRALMRYSHMMFGFERNKQAQDPNCSIIRLLKSRKYGKSGTCKTYYEASTGRLTQRNWQDELYENRKVG
ncbi:toprim domain-containing protein [Pseudomonas brenneri]|uniref:toprim domain-containing protein n=1 Tax=Pseudomonas brenneri TaxID=129817 RepID=UPI0025A2062E|nr:toprim domain-containing protein [Pseudomonas brenneri]WJM94045.1 toprim domain-containing protein [Pseudomonas brenneri]